MREPTIPPTIATAATTAAATPAARTYLEELLSFFGVDDCYGLYLIEYNALCTEHFSVIPVSLLLEEENFGSVDHTPTAVFVILFVGLFEAFVKNIDILLSVLFAYGFFKLCKQAVAGRIG